MMPWMVLVLVSRKVKGMPVGVEPTFRVCCAEAGRAPMRRAAAARPVTIRFRLMGAPPGFVPLPCGRFHLYEKCCMVPRATQAPR